MADLSTRREYLYAAVTQFGRPVTTGLASGEDTQTTARRIGRTENTIKTHRRKLYAKLGAKSGAHAVLIAVSVGLLHAPKVQTVSGGDA
ncbi:LuxR C-terminal-related transcriptional regulator [Streptomyces sp. NPDC048188]|uniref:response regulator transcription factor n=1 Tax=Streptomyces sp. NPDC048188 TaxID=3155749 RepID=UPI0034158A72